MYLLASFVFEMLIWTIGIVVFVVLMLLIPNTTYFTHIDFSTQILFLLLVGSSTTVFGFAIASALHTVKSGLFVGIIFVAI